jgi:hypothetical protein
MDELTGEQVRLKEAFIAGRGYWSDFWDDVLRLDPELFEAHLNFTMVPWRKGHLAPKFKELIYVAVDAATTHLYEPGLRAHIRRALDLGATKEEIIEVYELISSLGIHTFTMGLPVLVEELDVRGH